MFSFQQRRAFYVVIFVTLLLVSVIGLGILLTLIYLNPKEAELPEFLANTPRGILLKVTFFDFT
jgi:hypothetical protein